MYIYVLFFTCVIIYLGLLYFSFCFSCNDTLSGSDKNNNDTAYIIIDIMAIIFIDIFCFTAKIYFLC